jgi:hypothetical protein
MPAWLNILLQTGEFLAFGLYFLLLSALARRQNPGREREGAAKTWAYIEFALFILFTLLFFSLGMQGLQFTIFGALYLISLILAMVLTIQMRKTVETISY